MDDLKQKQRVDQGGSKVSDGHCDLSNYVVSGYTHSYKTCNFFIITILLICKTTDTVTLHTQKLQYNSSQTKACVTIAVLKVLAKASYRMQGLLFLKWHHSPNKLQLTWTRKSFSLILFSVATDPSDLGTKCSSGTKLLAKLHPSIIHQTKTPLWSTKWKVAYISCVEK